MLKQIIISIRPRQWYKNLVIFAGIIFSLNITNHGMWKGCILAFTAFCLISGANYIFNDIIDRKKDALHPSKRSRPIASGKLNTTKALLSGGVILLAGFFISLFVNTGFSLILLSYIILTLLYSFHLKEAIVADLLSISLGFVIRAVAGCIAISVVISPWLIVCAFLLAMFLALGKRRGELETLKENAGEHRKSLAAYTKETLDMLLSITTAMLITAYSLYTFLTGHTLLLLTIPFPVYCIFKYLILIKEKGFGEEPEKALRDRGIVLGAILWTLTTAIILFQPNLY